MNPLKTQKDPESVSSSFLFSTYTSFLHQLLNLPQPAPNPSSAHPQASILLSSLQSLIHPTRREVFSFSLIEKIDCCSPTLRQIWRLSITPSSQISEPTQLFKNSLNPSNPSNSTNPTINSSLSQQLFQFVSSFPSQFFIYSHNLTLDLHPLNSSSVSWEIFQRNNLKYFPIAPYEINSENFQISLQIEYCDLDFRPKITEQNLGLRPRLVSFDMDETRDNFGLKYLEDTYEKQDSIERKKILKQQALISCERFYQENEIGFSLLSSTLPDDLESEADDPGQDLFEFSNLVVLDDEDCEVSLYVQNCVKAAQFKVFGELTSPEALLREWLESK